MRFPTRPRWTVSELDRLKEKLVFQRLKPPPRLFALGVGGIIVLGLGIYRLHRQIKRRIKQIRSL